MNRMLIAAPAALLFAIATVLGATPVLARDGGCAAASQLRGAAASAQADAQQKALRYVVTAEKLCEAGNDRAGKAKLDLAAKALGVDQAALVIPAVATGQ